MTGFLIFSQTHQIWTLANGCGGAVDQTEMRTAGTETFILGPSGLSGGMKDLNVEGLGGCPLNDFHIRSVPFIGLKSQQYCDNSKTIR